MQLPGFVAVMLRMQVVGVGDMRVVRRRLVASFGVSLRRLAVVLGRVFMVLRRLLVVLDLLFVGHDVSGLRFSRVPRDWGPSEI